MGDLKEDYASITQKETESNSKKNEFEKKLELAEAETVTAKNDLKLAMKRIDDLQVAINGELDSDLDSHSDGESDSSEDEGMSTFLDHHRRACSVQPEGGQGLHCQRIRRQTVSDYAGGARNKIVG